MSHADGHDRPVDLVVDVQGDGRPVLLLHGQPDSARLWRYVTPRLVDAGRRVIAPDQRGCGRSPAPTGRAPYRLDQLTRDVIDVLDAHGISGPVDVVGHDWGAFVGWSLAIFHPERVRRLVALSVGHPRAYARAGLEQKIKGAYVLGWQVPRVAEAWLSANDFRRMRRSLASHPDLDDVVGDLARPGRMTAVLTWYRANLTNLIRVRSWPPSSVPTLGVWGTEDKYLAEDQMRNSEHLVDAGWRYERFNGAGHWLPLERADDTTRLILEWIEAPAPVPA
jgi:pimeloyl-ACP methyl ester carboxylesterase